MHGHGETHHDLSSMRNPAHSLPATRSVPVFVAREDTEFPHEDQLRSPLPPSTPAADEPTVSIPEVAGPTEAADSTQAASHTEAADAEQSRPWFKTLAGIIGIFIVINLIALGFGALFF
ncbi:hypothetical protein CCICO_02720 [Corynebacterium ciconiae DSM 44920]|nr:hypothetical protein CCICO_02720 [Corynebacterium ciconiae DSM 44920]